MAMGLPMCASKPAATALMPHTVGLRLYGSAMKFGQLLDKRKADAETWLRAIGADFHLLEHLEDAFKVLRRNSDSGVLHRQLRRCALDHQLDADAAAVRSELSDHFVRDV